jgi:hypothetical protein
MKKVKVKLSNKNGNIFNLGQICKEELEKKGFRKEAKEMIHKILRTHSYTNVLVVLSQYCDII